MEKSSPDDHLFVRVPHQTGCKRCGYASGHHPNRVQLSDQLRRDRAAKKQAQFCPHCGAGPAAADGELPHFRDCQDA